jgi:hypothetical protein
MNLVNATEFLTRHALPNGKSPHNGKSMVKFLSKRKTVKFINQRMLVNLNDLTYMVSFSEGEGEAQETLLHIDLFLEFLEYCGFIAREGKLQYMVRSMTTAGTRERVLSELMINYLDIRDVNDISNEFAMISGVASKFNLVGDKLNKLKDDYCDIVKTGVRYTSEPDYGGGFYVDVHVDSYMDRYERLCASCG